MSSWRSLFLALFCILALPQTGLAAASADASKNSTRLDAVVVTATKGETDLQKTAASISTFDDTQINDANMNFVQDLGLRVPNLGFYTGGMNVINFPTMRGVRSDPHNNISSVTLYVDDVPCTSNLGYVSDLYDIERIEVLRGPQGTLYGRGTEGGVINIITKKPGNDPSGKATMEVGSGHMFHAKGDISGALIKDMMYLGLAVDGYRRDGWIHNDYDDSLVDDQGNISGRGTLRLTPTEQLEITLMASLLKYDEGSFSMYAWPSDDNRHVNTDTPGYNRSSIDEQALHVKYDFTDEWSLTSITSRRYTNADYEVDYDFSTMKGWETHKYDKYSDIGEELRLNYQDDDGASFLLGAYLNKYDRKVQYEYVASGAATETKDVTDTYSAFAHAKYPVWGGLSLIGGLRMDTYTTKFNSEPFDDTKTWNAFSPKAGLEYQITDNNMAYATVSRGYRAGGFNSYSPPSGQYEFDEETMWAYELGSKNFFFDKTLKVNAAVFLNDFQDIQVEQYVMNGMMPMPYTANSGDTQAWGGELEISWFPIPSLELFGTLGYTHMRYGNFTDALGDHKDNHLPFVPDYTYSGGAQYRHSSGLFARAEVLGSSKVYLDSSNECTIPEHATVNAKVGWEFEKTDVYVFATNLFDERYDYEGAFGGGYAVATAPLTLGLNVTYHFF
ncbi:MAG: TonB-dependent receptor [Desulfovibrio sp.]|uniref:TonB-dependent receptor n=1 Tax=Desulfovibrio sp. 7SRBS1 TaxID=3378064 RepID=UPI003B417C92